MGSYFVNTQTYMTYIQPKAERISKEIFQILSESYPINLWSKVLKSTFKSYLLKLYTYHVNSADAFEKAASKN